VAALGEEAREKIGLRPARLRGVSKGNYRVEGSEWEQAGGRERSDHSNNWEKHFFSKTGNRL